MADVMISLKEDRKCVECGKGWAAQSGICLKCVNKAMKFTNKMKSAAGRALQARYREIFGKK